MPNDVPDWTVSFTQLVGELTVTDLKVTGLAGAATVSRYAGAVSGAAPVSGTFVNGDYVVDISTTSPGFWVCTVGGTPGTWVRSESLMPVPVTISNDGPGTPNNAQLVLNRVTAGGNAGVAYRDAGVTKWFVGKDSVNLLNFFNATLSSSALQLDPGNNIATFGAEARAPDFKASGITGAQAASRYAGATNGGPPTGGTFAVGDFVADNLWGILWTCITAGTPGTWRPSGPAIISDQTVSTVASVTLPATGSLPTYFTDLEVTCTRLRGDMAANAVQLTGPIFNGDGTGTTNYDNQWADTFGAATTSANSSSGGSPRAGVIPAASTAAGVTARARIKVEEYNFVGRHNWFGDNSRNDNDESIALVVVSGNYHPAVATAITSVGFAALAGNLSGRFILRAW